MAHDKELKQRAEKLYVDDFLPLGDIAGQLSVPLATVYRWAKKGNWSEAREDQLGMRDKLGSMLSKLIERAEESPADVDAGLLFGLYKLYEKWQKTGAVRERIVYQEDAEVLLETMKEMEAFALLLNDPVVLSELGERLKEKQRNKN